MDESGGTYGLGLHVFGRRQLLQPGETGYVPGISNSENKDEGFRTNLGLLNTDAQQWTRIRLTLLKLDGSLAAEPLDWSIPPGVLQQFDVFRKFGLRKETMTGTIQIDVLSGGGVAAYATEIDNRTQDSIYIPAQQALIGGSD